MITLSRPENECGCSKHTIHAYMESMFTASSNYYYIIFCIRFEFLYVLLYYVISVDQYACIIMLKYENELNY